METKHRYRLLLYFAALVLCLSVCFAYAEGPATTSATISDSCTGIADTQPLRLLFNAAPGRSTFLATLPVTLKLDTEDAPPATADAVLQQLTQQNNRSHSFLRAVFPGRHKLRLVKQHSQEHLSTAAATTQMAAGSEE